jgi:hypothetical protein
MSRAPGRRPPGDRAPLHDHSTLEGGGRIVSSLTPGSRAVADKLWRLREHYGYLTRDEIALALGQDPHRGRWECPGQFGPDGRYVRHCGEAAA